MGGDIEVITVFNLVANFLGMGEPPPARSPRRQSSDVVNVRWHFR
jgi:hypothetical protein